MKKSKLLMPIIAASSLVACTTPLMLATSCNKSTTEDIYLLYEDDIYQEAFCNDVMPLNFLHKMANPQSCQGLKISLTDLKINNKETTIQKDTEKFLSYKWKRHGDDAYVRVDFTISEFISQYWSGKSTGCLVEFSLKFTSSFTGFSKTISGYKINISHSTETMENTMDFRSDFYSMDVFEEDHSGESGGGGWISPYSPYSPYAASNTAVRSTNASQWCYETSFDLGFRYSPRLFETYGYSTLEFNNADIDGFYNPTGTTTTFKPALMYFSKVSSTCYGINSVYPTIDIPTVIKTISMGAYEGNFHLWMPHTNTETAGLTTLDLATMNENATTTGGTKIEPKVTSGTATGYTFVSAGSLAYNTKLEKVVFGPNTVLTCANLGEYYGSPAFYGSSTATKANVGASDESYYWHTSPFAACKSINYIDVSAYGNLPDDTTERNELIRWSSSPTSDNTQLWQTKDWGGVDEQYTHSPGAGKIIVKRSEDIDKWKAIFISHGFTEDEFTRATDPWTIEVKS